MDAAGGGGGCVGSLGGRGGHDRWGRGPAPTGPRLLPTGLHSQNLGERNLLVVVGSGVALNNNNKKNVE